MAGAREAGLVLLAIGIAAGIIGINWLVVRSAVQCPPCNGGSSTPPAPTQSSAYREPVHTVPTYIDARPSSL